MSKAGVKLARKKRSVSTARKLHRSFGVAASVFVIFMVISGLVINHSNSLGLDQKRTSNSLILDWYGLDKPFGVESYQAGNNWLSKAGSQLFFNDTQISGISEMVGAVSSNGVLIVAGQDELLLIDEQGQLIERQAWKSFNNAPIDSIGMQENGLVVLTSASQLWSPDANFITWEKNALSAGSTLWSKPESLPFALKESIVRQYRGEGLSLERILLDLHSGRFFGTFGVLVYDLLAIILGFLAVSGLVLWSRSKRNGKPKAKHSKRR